MLPILQASSPGLYQMIRRYFRFVYFHSHCPFTITVLSLSVCILLYASGGIHGTLESIISNGFSSTLRYRWALSMKYNEAVDGSYANGPTIFCKSIAVVFPSILIGGKATSYWLIYCPVLLYTSKAMFWLSFKLMQVIRYPIVGITGMPLQCQLLYNCHL